MTLGELADDQGVRDGLASVTRGTALLLFATLSFVGLGFVARVLLIRSITLGEWDAYSFGLSLTGILAAIGTLGLPSAVARSLPYANSDDDRRRIVRTTFVLGAVSAAAAAGLLFAFAGPIGRAVGSTDVTLALEFLPIAVACGVLQSLIASVFQGFEDVVPNAIFVLILNPTLFLAFLLALWASPTGVGFEVSLAAYVAANVVTLATLAVYAFRRLPSRLGRKLGPPEASRDLLRLAAPLFLVGVMTSIVGMGDTLILGIYHNGEVGTYSASLTLARLVQLGIGAAGYIFLPVAAKFLRRNDPASVRLTYGTVTKWMVLVSMPLLLLFVFLPGASLGLVYGKGYTSVLLPLQLTSLAAFVTALLGPASQAQVAFGDARLQAYNAVAAGVVDVAVALVLVPPYGYVGAAAAWGTANLTWAVLCLAELASLRGVHPFRGSFLFPLIGTTVPLAALLFLAGPRIAEWMLPPIGLGAAAVYVALVLLTGSIDRGDLLLLEVVEGLVGRPLPRLRRLGRFALRGNPRS